MTNADLQRIRNERKIISKVLDHALRLGPVWLSVDDGALTVNKQQLLENILAADEAKLYFHHGRQPQAYAWVHFVLGNDDGTTVIADNTTNLDEVLKPAEALAERLA